MKRVKQVSFDILVDSNVDGTELAKRIERELKSRGFKVLGSGFQYDFTDEYKEYFPKMLEEDTK